MSFTFDGRDIPFSVGDSIAIALLRAGVHPTGGGCICLGGDCPHCLVKVDGVAYIRSCQMKAEAGLSIESQAGDPQLPNRVDPEPVAVRTVFADVVVVGQGESGRQAAAGASGEVITFDAGRGEEVIGVYAGPMVVVRTLEGMLHVHCQRVIVATGAAEEQSICPGSNLIGIYTKRAAEALSLAGIDLGRTVVIDRQPIRFEGAERVEAVVMDDETRLEGDSVILDLGLHPRDALARMGAGLELETTGGAAIAGQLPSIPTAGVVCPCSGIEVSDLESVWERGFREMELLKRATLAGTGTCQGGVCLPHLRSFLAARQSEVPSPFTARPVTRQLTMSEAAAGYDLSPFRRTSLHNEHVRLGASMDRFGGWWRPWRYPDVDAEYRAVRHAVSLGDVGTLGKMLLSGPDATEFLERLYPCRVADLKPGRVRYALLLDERGYVIDDGLICRLSESRFFLTFTSGGASFAEMWVRDWAETFGLDVRLLDRTMSLGAINVTGPRATELMNRLGVSDPPRYLAHVEADVAGVPCRIVRLSFTGEVSFELHHPVDRSVELWRALEAAGSDLDLYPHGLDVLFTLRLEKGHFIVGMDSEYDSTPRRLGLEWAARLDKEDFVGKQALLRTNRIPLNKRLVGWEMEGPAPVEGSILMVDERPVGQVTSSRFSPTLDKTVMLGWIRLTDSEVPHEVEVEGRVARHAAHPFYDTSGERARG
ncbi:MAG: 2Fe-2S iron-sulfur cluster-binding protein [Acidimicrobiia bacterium]